MSPPRISGGLGRGPEWVGSEGREGASTVLRVCVFARALVCMCSVGPCAKGPEKPGLRVVGQTAQEPWKSPEQGGGSETRDGGRERAERKAATELVGGGLGAPRGGLPAGVFGAKSAEVSGT